MTIKTTLSLSAPVSILARRRWLKGTGALLGLAVLSAPAQALALAPKAIINAEAIGTVKLLSSTVVPQGWLLCDGRALAVEQYPALFALLGTTYGGDGRRTFALPDIHTDLATLAIPAQTNGPLCAIKVAAAPALTTAGAELRLRHQRQG